jgi:hypothetical protein
MTVPRETADPREPALAAPHGITVDDDELHDWCVRHLRSAPIATLFRAGHLALVAGLTLADGRDVVVKVRPGEPRLSGCAAVQRRLWRAGFACPRPLVDPTPLGAYAASAEAAMLGGGPLEPDRAGAECFASLLAELIRLAPDSADTPTLHPAPAWMHWYHPGEGVWPPPDDRPDDLNAHPETSWLDDIGARVRRKLDALRAAPHVIGHCDWEAQNVQWLDGRPFAVYDWDSVVCEPEPVIVGQAAAMWPASENIVGATVEQTEEFLDAYQRAREVPFTALALEQAWAAGLWVRAFNAKKWLLDGFDSLSHDEANHRLARSVA